MPFGTKLTVNNPNEMTLNLGAVLESSVDAPKLKAAHFLSALAGALASGSCREKKYFQTDAPEGSFRAFPYHKEI
jgi:hypothetical protein